MSAPDERDLARRTDLNLAEVHEAIGAAVPDRECLVWRDRHLTWADVTDRTRRLAALLGPGRVAPDDGPGWVSPHRHVALYLTNGNEYLEGMVGAAKAAWGAVNVNYRYVADELAYVLDDSAAAAVIYHGRFASTLAEVLPRLARPPELLLRVDDGSGDPLLAGARDYEEALASVEPVPWPPPWPLSPADRYILYTGGTTGNPKGVLWRQADFLATCLGVTGTTADLAAKAPASTLRTLPAAPFMHGAAHWNALSTWIAGGTVIVQDHPDRLDAADLLDTCEREQVSSILVVGDAFARPIVDELGRAERDLSALRFLLTGGAVLSPTVKGELLAALPALRIVDVLGSSETGRQGVQSSRAGHSAPATFERSATTVVLSADGTRTLDPGDPELGWLAQGGRIPLGYLGDQAKTEATFRTVGGQRYAVAGDRARIRDDGSIELHGRDSVTINTGGEKVFAEEVEQVLKGHPAVYDALVVGRPSERWGQAVAAVVSLRPGAPAPTPADLRTAAAAHLARYKLPRTIVFAPAVARSPSGKPDYAWARAQVTDAADGDTIA